ncbi:hypothetical protein [Duodenibacillus massiliensis]|uniref:hypothetical protein n=1 Tax=Duodenibacillus massiliensis TaxID=1852381 RepID=UPI001160ECF3|nr:hypothetical protein [Duodenibacillus massiliensis]
MTDNGIQQENNLEKGAKIRARAVLRALKKLVCFKSQVFFPCLATHICGQLTSGPATTIFLGETK